jgi:hypothetical protein
LPVNPGGGGGGEVDVANLFLCFPVQNCLPAVAQTYDLNCMHEEIKSRLNSGNACCRSVHSLLSSRLLSGNVKVKIHKTIVLPVVLYGCETWSVPLREEHRLITHLEVEFREF